MNLDFLKRIRRTHALEHATITIAQSRMDEQGILGGNSTHWGFFVYGNVPTELLSQAAEEALNRLKSGEKHLAISPFCGTNLVVGAALAGLACSWAMGSERRLSNIPRVISYALGAILLSRPIGSLVQKHLTTDGYVGRLSIKDISHIGVGGVKVHRVRTSSGD